jgi:hypothetical protein
MSQQEETDRHASPLKARPAVRKPYRKPAVRHERVFETSALSCGKVQTTESGCHANRKAS